MNFSSPYYRNMNSLVLVVSICGFFSSTDAAVKLRKLLSLKFYLIFKSTEVYKTFTGEIGHFVRKSPHSRKKIIEKY